MGKLSLLHQLRLRLRIHQPFTRDMRADAIDRLKKLSLAGAGIIALLSGSACAADLARPAPVYAPPPPPVVAVFTWTGCYVGGNVGGIWASSDWQLGLVSAEHGSVSAGGDAYSDHHPPCLA
jgi:hypothetical protein